MYGFACAKSGCSGVGGVAKWRKYATQIFVMELHRRGSKRYITPTSRRSDASYLKNSSTIATVAFLRHFHSLIDFLEICY
jgi:hypothetical protein